MTPDSYPPSRPIVFWDIDGTLVSGSLERTFLSYMRKKKFVSAGSVLLNLLALAPRFPFPKWYQLKLCYLKGISVTNLEAWAKSCWLEELESKLFADAQDAIGRFTDLEARQVILSGTIMPLAKQLASHFGITEIIAANPEVRDGVCTGRTVAAHPHGEVKVERVAEWLSKKNEKWSSVIAIANHWDDRFLLERSGTPIAAHPDEKLRAYAIKQGWLIVDELRELASFSL